MSKKEGLCLTGKAFKNQGFVQTGPYRPFTLANDVAIVIQGSILKHNFYQDFHSHFIAALKWHIYRLHF